MCVRLTCCAVLWPGGCVCCSTVFEDVYQAVVYGIEEQLTGEEERREGFAFSLTARRVVVDWSTDGQ